MTSLAQIAKTASMPVTPLHERFLAQGDPVYSPEALEFARAVLSRDIGGQRKGRERKWRASGMGSCLRARVFHRAGVPEVSKPDTRLQNIFNNGNFAHLRWQMAGLSAGWLKEAEVPADTEILGTTLDGILVDGSILEFKSINTRGYGLVHDYGVDSKHELQVHAMFKATGKAAASVVYEDKNTQEWEEHRVVLNPETMAQVDRELDVLQEVWEARKKNFPMKLDCIEKKGSEWRNCPFRDACPKMSTFVQIQKALPPRSITA